MTPWCWTGSRRHQQGTAHSGDLRLVTSVVARSEALRPESALFDRFGARMSLERAAPALAAVAQRATMTTAGAPATARGGGRGAGTGTGRPQVLVQPDLRNATTVGRGARGGGGAWLAGTGASTVSGTTRPAAVGRAVHEHDDDGAGAVAEGRGRALDLVDFQRGIFRRARAVHVGALARAQTAEWRGAGAAALNPVRPRRRGLFLPAGPGEHVKGRGDGGHHRPAAGESASWRGRHGRAGAVRPARHAPGAGRPCDRRGHRDGRSARDVQDSAVDLPPRPVYRVRPGC